VSRSLIDRAKLIAGRVPRFVTIGERDPQQQVRVMLHGIGPSVDVTRRHLIASLRPLVVALGLPESAVTSSSGQARLVFTTLDAGRLLGHVDLTHHTRLSSGHARLELFRVAAYREACISPAPAAIYALAHAWAERRQVATFAMPRRDRRAVEVLYMCPRPVVLVSVAHNGNRNMFPMDLIGAVDPQHFVLALRSTSPSVELITGSRRVALADVPLEHAGLATGLGDRHKKAHMDWDNLPFDTVLSAVYGLTVLRGALRVREMAVRGVEEVGSHSLFIGEMVREERRDDGLQMFTISGPYYRHAVLQGRSIPVVFGEGRA
jgi:flavin reductase (DIM6/NTAB) family NADH-FMN oxidoreductase RutF